METNTSSTTSSPSIVLYDIAFAPPYEKNTSAPNPWKARYALNFKGVPYSTHWVQMPKISKVRQNLGASAGRKFADGTDFYTLPVVTDSNTRSTIGDSFDIADYLQNTFPNDGAGDLFPSQELDFECPGSSLIPLSERSDDLRPVYAKFNSHVDMVFSMHAQLTAFGMRWDPALADEIKAEFARRAGVESFDLFKIEGEAREKLKMSLRDRLGDLAVMFQRDTSGPFLLGKQPSYGDIIVGGWLRMLSMTLPDSEWEEVQAWHNGVFGTLHATMQLRFGDVK